MREKGTTNETVTEVGGEQGKGGRKAGGGAERRGREEGGS